MVKLKTLISITATLISLHVRAAETIPSIPNNLPPQLLERIVCSIAASVHYDVPANIVLAVAEKEAGKPGQWVRNTNGTHDVGTMQFNTGYIKTLTAKYGITADDVATEGCYAYDLAAWRLHGHLTNDTGDIWTKAANYHSRTPYYNAIYRADLITRATKWADRLDEMLSGDSSKINAALSALATPAPKAAKAVQIKPENNPMLRTTGLSTSYVPRQVVAKSDE